MPLCPIVTYDTFQAGTLAHDVPMGLLLPLPIPLCNNIVCLLP